MHRRQKLVPSSRRTRSIPSSSSRDRGERSAMAAAFCSTSAGLYMPGITTVTLGLAPMKRRARLASSMAPPARGFMAMKAMSFSRAGP